MPYEWTTPSGPDAPSAELHLWPYRSLPKRGFVTFFSITFGLVALPFLAVLGSAVLWGLLPFVALTLGGLWMALQRSYRDGSVLEELRLWPTCVVLTRHNPGGAPQEWTANPHWITLSRHDDGGPVPAYLTLRGAGREVEIGAFLSEAERRTLEKELASVLRAMDQPDTSGG